MAEKTKEEVQGWLNEKKAGKPARKKGDKLVIHDEPTQSPSIGRMKKEIEVL